MSIDEKLCQQCTHFSPTPGRVTHIGFCDYPLPAWLNEYLLWARNGSGIRQIQRGVTQCSTYEAKS